METQETKERNGRKQHEAEQERHEAKEDWVVGVRQLETVFEAMTDGIFVFDKDGRILRMNRAARDLLGLDDLASYTALSLEERGALTTQRYVQGQSLPLAQWATSRVLNGEVHTGMTAVEFTLRNRHNREMRIHVSGAPLRDQQGNIVGAINICRDVTDRWRLERERILQERAEASARELALSEMAQQMDEFLGILAHELRAPLSNLRGFAQTLLVQTALGRGPHLVEWQKKALAGLDLAAGCLSELIDDLLDVARLHAGRMELHPEPTDLVSLIQRVITRLQLTTTQHTLSYLPAMERLVRHVDPRRMEQVVGNLLTNAIKYSPEGGLIEVMIAEDSERQEALLSIRDHGIGIPTPQQAQIFQRFVQAENARAYGIEGIGLGLYLCHALVTRHQGRIWCESSEGQGSTFFVALPDLHTQSGAGEEQD